MTCMDVNGCPGYRSVPMDVCTESWPDSLAAQTYPSEDALESVSRACV